MPIPATPTHIIRYPQSLSQRPGPSRFNRPQRSTKQALYLPESIDDTVPPLPPIPDASTVAPHQYSSLAELLQQAGYKETRVYTPENEKRRIKQTLDEDDEINALYGAFGMTLSTKGNRVHTRQEPSQPMKSSSSLLRRLALQDLPDNSTPTKSSQSRSPPDGWWGGNIAASLGRAAKSVIETSPPAPHLSTPAPIDLPPVGLAKPGSVRKVNSNGQLHRSRRNMTEEPDQEQRPPSRSARSPRALTESPKRNSDFVPLSSSMKALMESAPPPEPSTFEDDAFGFSPLPLDYEDQCEEDIYNGSDPFHVGSLGSSSANSERDAESITDLGSQSTLASLREGAGGRIMVDAIEYDEEFDSPTRHELVLPIVDVEHVIAESSEGAEKPVRPLKYGDRATKLRMSRSTPVLKRQPSWLDSIRSAVLSRAGYEAVPDPPVTSLPRIPINVSPAVLAAPTLITQSPVICDSASAEAVDLPAIPASMQPSQKTNDSYVPLRLRSSLAALRSAVGLPERTLSKEDAPVLSPRLDWQSQGSQFAGWEKDQDPSDQVDLRGLGFGSRGTGGTSIDYSKSFFYKPATPPHPSHKTNKAHEEPVTPSSKKEAVLGKRRSIKSLRAALLLPVADTPPVPALPTQYKVNRTPSTPPQEGPMFPLHPPVLAISSPGAWEAGLPPRELVLEGEEWDARDGGAPGDWGRRKMKSNKKTLKKRRSVYKG